MNINVELGSKSFKNAIKQLEHFKKNILKKQLVEEFLNDCKVYLLEKMTLYLQMSGVGSKVVSNINNSWVSNIIGNKLTMINKDDKAVFVEFGVGIVGSQNSHPNAFKEAYSYNVESQAKGADGSWHFYSDEQELDMPKSSIDWGSYGKGKNNRMSIHTRGTKGVWYAYNAIQDLIINCQKIWQKTKERVLV